MHMVAQIATRSKRISPVRRSLGVGWKWVRAYLLPLALITGPLWCAEKIISLQQLATLPEVCQALIAKFKIKTQSPRGVKRLHDELS